LWATLLIAAEAMTRFKEDGLRFLFLFLEVSSRGSPPTDGNLYFLMFQNIRFFSSGKLWPILLIAAEALTCLKENELRFLFT
jgi:hypothetical protein